jgi:hypothetical protein
MTTNDCKLAIIAAVKADPEHVQRQFTERVDISPALIEGNWKRLSKVNLASGIVRREFDCKPYDDQLRAIVIESNGKLSVVIQGE